MLIAQIILAVILIVMIILQTSPETSSQKTSLIQPTFTRRGLEKVGFIVTIILLLSFISLSFAQLII